jgi:nucleotide-binding universal stress UspA family protein
MTEPFRMLFGIDESEFSMESLAAVGRLYAGKQGVGMTLFHGAPDLRNMLVSLSHLDDDSVEEYVKMLRSQSKKSLDKGKKILVDSGMDEEMISVVLEESCGDPAGSMLDLAEEEGFDVVGLARLGAGTVGRYVIGSVSYRLACSSEKFPVWIVDHRIRSRNCLICPVGAPIGERVLDHAASRFSHMEESRFTLFHVISPLSLEEGRVTGRGRLPDDLKLRVKNAEKILEEGKTRLIAAGIPEKNITLKKKVQEKGIARDILAELESGDNGILVAGRKGSGDIKEFGLGSKAYKLLCAARAFTLCLVN